MKRRILTAALSVLLAVVGTTAVVLYLHQANARALAGQKAVSVMVASRQIPSGTSAREALDEGLLSSQRMPAASVPADAVTAITSSLGSLVTNAEIEAGQLLLLPMLVPATEASTGIAIPQGKMAVTVQLCLPEDVAGSVRPGSQVAVFDTFAGGTLTAQPNCDGPHQQQDLGNVHTRIVMASVLVLSVGEAAPPTQAGTQATSASSQPSTSAGSSQGTELVTLAVSPSEADQLIQFTETGLPYLGLLPG